jgi:hypothetical protein
LLLHGRDGDVPTRPPPKGRTSGENHNCSVRAKVLESVVVKDLSWATLGRLLRVSDKTASSHAVEAIKALADWRAGRAVAPPPVIRYRIEPGRQ